MKARAFALVVVGGLLGATVLACSSAPTAENSPTKSSGRKNGGTTTSTADDTSASSSDSTTTSAQEGAAPSSTSTPEGGAGDAGDGGATPPKTPPKLVCDAIPTCANIQALKSISGDGSEQTSFSGAGSQWLSIHIREDSLASAPIGFSAELYSPQDATYEMYVYTSDCKTALGTSTQLSDGAEAIASWSDTSFLDDAKDVMIEIRHVDGACASGDDWKLDILGGVF